jgi:hypothetical protein
MQSLPTVKDHLMALGETPGWIVSLGEAIQQVTDCSTAIAAARARDLSRCEDLGQGLEWLTRGWLTLEAADPQSLSPMQRETIRLVLEGVLVRVKTRYREDRTSGTLEEA